MRHLVLVSIVVCTITLLYASGEVQAHALPPTSILPRQERRSCCDVDYCQTQQQKDTCKTEWPDNCCHACKGSPSQCGEEPRKPPPRRPPPTPPRRRNELVDSLLPRKQDKCCNIEPCHIYHEVQTCSTDFPLPCCHGCKGISQFCPKPPQRRDELTDSLLPRRPSPCCDTDPCHTPEENLTCLTSDKSPCCDGCRGNSQLCGKSLARRGIKLTNSLLPRAQQACCHTEPCHTELQALTCFTEEKLPCCDGCKGIPQLCGGPPPQRRIELTDILLPRAQQPCCSRDPCKNEVEALSCLSSQKLPCCDGCKGNSQLCGKSPARPRNELADSLLLARQPPPTPYTNCCQIDPCPFWPLDCESEAPTNQCCFSCKKDLQKCPKSTLSSKRSVESPKVPSFENVGSGLLPRVPTEDMSVMLLPRQIPPPPYKDCCEIPPCNFPSLCNGEPYPEEQCCYSCQKESKCKKKPPGKRSLDSAESLVHREVSPRVTDPVTGSLFARDDFKCCNYDNCGSDHRCFQNSPPDCCFGCKGTPMCQGAKSPGKGRFKPAPSPNTRRSLDFAVEFFDDRIFSRSHANSDEKDRLLPRQLDACCQTASCATNKALCGPGKYAPCCTGCQGSVLCRPKHGPGKRQHDERSLESTTNSFNDDIHIPRSALESAEHVLSRRADTCCDTAPCATLNEQSRCTLPGHKLSCCSGCKGSPQCNPGQGSTKRHHDERSLDSADDTLFDRSIVTSPQQLDNVVERFENSDRDLLSRASSEPDALVRVPKTTPHCCSVDKCLPGESPGCEEPDAPDCCHSCKGDKRCHGGAVPG